MKPFDRSLAMLLLGGCLCVAIFASASHEHDAQADFGISSHSSETCGAKSEKTEPTLFPDGEFYDLGKVTRGQVCKLSVRMVNTTKAPIEVAEIRLG